MALSSFSINAIAFLLVSVLTVALSSVEKQTYIVHMSPSSKPEAYPTHHDWYSATLLTTTASLDSSSLLYSYSASFPGFAVALSETEAESLSQSDAVSAIYKDTLYSLHTTRSPEFLGLESANFESYSGEIDRASHDVVIGVLDTGVWPESKSFDDTGIPPVPPRWRGECESGPDFSPSLCNNKLIGARFFSKGYLTAFGLGLSNKPKEEESPRDRDGHGTHTASTAAGSVVPNASLFGYASGSARGMATHARVASYKVCWGSGCFGSDILAGLDRAIEDGVDVLSLSLGGGSGPYYKDTIAIGAFAALKRGIFVACSAGNSGPAHATVANVAPWITTVGAGTLDRDFPGYVSLSNWKQNYTGVTLYSGAGMSEPVGLVYSKGTDTSSRLCMPGSLNPDVVSGKVVLCDRGINPRVEKGEVVRNAGGVGMILANTATQGEELVADSHLLPAVAVGRKTGDLIREYARNDSNPTAVLRFGGTVLNVTPSPVVAAFSSRGPNTVTPQILKPDVIGPGVNILAGWADGVGPTGLTNDTRKTRFNILSGTSMSCPHIAGIAALIKAAHPSWSPSAVKSALMTTAYDVDNTRAALRDAASGMNSTAFMHGAGHVNPQRAVSPGLVYDASESDYVAFLCASGYTVDEVRAVAKIADVNCSGKMRSAGDLNYPSFSVVFGKSRVVRYTRELTNVGEGGDAYDVAVNMPEFVQVTVKPERLVFSNVGDKHTYTATFVARKGMVWNAKHGFGSLVWRNGHREVKSQIAFSWAG